MAGKKKGDYTPPESLIESFNGVFEFTKLAFVFEADPETLRRDPKRWAAFCKVAESLREFAVTIADDTKDALAFELFRKLQAAYTQGKSGDDVSRAQAQMRVDCLIRIAEFGFGRKIPEQDRRTLLMPLMTGLELNRPAIAAAQNISLLTGKAAEALTKHFRKHIRPSLEDAAKGEDLAWRAAADCDFLGAYLLDRTFSGGIDDGDARSFIQRRFRQHVVPKVETRASGEARL